MQRELADELDHESPPSHAPHRLTCRPRARSRRRRAARVVNPARTRRRGGSRPWRARTWTPTPRRAEGGVAGRSVCSAWAASAESSASKPCVHASKPRRRRRGVDVACTAGTRRRINSAHALQERSAPRQELRAMKIIVLYDACASAELHHKLAITLPAKWMDQSVDKVKDLFVGAYNKKFPSTPLEADALVLQVRDASPFTVADTKLLKSADTPAKVFEEKGEVRLGRSRRRRRAAAAAPPRPSCRRACCAAELRLPEGGRPVDQHDGGPTQGRADLTTRASGGAAARRRRCTRSTSSSNPGVHRRPPLRRAARRGAAQAGGAGGGDGRRPERHSSAAEPGTGAARRRRSRTSRRRARRRRRAAEAAAAAAGRARYWHFGCQVEYSIADNGPTSCRYHASAPVFHEGTKKWVCCGVKKYDFDEFLAVPGCVTGPHEPEDDE